MKAKIFEIKRFAVHDGNGIRTTVFFKGCPLRCVWCHNPEGLTAPPVLAYYSHKCIGCGECAEVCPQNAHIFNTDGHFLLRERCVGCGKCTEVCLGEALTLYGKEVTPQELLPLLLEDRDFYESSGGGVTLSGGECLVQADFCAELLKLLKAEGISTAVDTCGFVSRESLDKVIPHTDVFLYDLKAYDDEVHIRCTGHPCAGIIDNLRHLDSLGKRIEIRIPYVPGYNDGELEKLGRLIASLKHVSGVRLLPYHSYAGSKYAALDMEANMPPTVPTEELMKEKRAFLQGLIGDIPVIA